MPLDPYDQLPYTDHAYAEMHPDRLAVVARLAGWEPAAVERARVLELGCGRGGNLLPLAAWMPNAELVGIDRSGRQIQEARHIAAEIRLANVTLEQASFEQAEIAPGSFDYVLCHGVWSWVPVASRRVLLRLIARALAPGGVACVSFNVLPGWYAKMAARDWMRIASARGKDAAAALGWLVAQVSPELAAQRQQLADVAARLAETDRAYLVHEYLTEEHHPESIRTFLDESEEAGLAYLGDAIAENVAIEALPEAVAERAREGDAKNAQEVIDFVRCTAFRRALLVRADACAARSWQWRPALDARALRRMRIASRARLRGDVLEGPHGSVHVTCEHALHALDAIVSATPRSLPFVEVAKDADPDALASELFDVWLATGGIDLHVTEPAFATHVSDRPEASALARWHAADGGTITNAWHHEVQLRDDVVRWVLARTDGRTTADGLTRALRRDKIAHGISEHDCARLVRGSLEVLAASALLIA